MTPKRWNRITELFTLARKRSAGERDEFLARECGDDAELKGEVEKLLGADSLEDDFLENSAMAEADSFLDTETPPDWEPSAPRFDNGALLHNRYKIERLIGRGGMGEVYLATDTRINRKVALKVLHSDTVSSKESLRRFAIESQSVSALNHPHIITIYEFDYTEEGTMFLVAEYVDGQTLNHLIGQRLPLRKSLDIAMQVASALSAAHEAGITHRDIKPENIMIRRDGYAKVLDFGLAKLTESESADKRGSEDPTAALQHTKPGAVMGTASYMSPEQARGIGVDARSDVWSLGVVIYEMIAGVRPFGGATTADIIVSVLSAEPSPLSSHIGNCPPELEWIVSKALSKDVDDRYQTAKGLRADVDRVSKQIEFNSGLRSGGHGAVDEAAVVPTDVPEGATTAGEPAKDTHGGSGNASAFWSSPNLKTAFGQEGSRKFGVSVFATVLFAVVSAIIYFAFLTPRASAEINSIAVLPFENVSGNPDLNYASDGMSEALIDRLSQVPQLKVISRSSSFKFRGPNVNTRDAAEQMNARAIVTGSVRQVGDEIDVRVDIVDVAEDKQLGGAQYRRKANDLPAIQSEIAQAVSGQLGLKLTDAQSQRLTANGTQDSEAFRYYLSGLVEAATGNSERGLALEYFQRAVDLDPNFADAYAEIGHAYWVVANGSGDPGVAMPRAAAAAARALELNPNLPKAHVISAMVREYEFNWAAAEAAYRRAIELSPNSDYARQNFAFFLSIIGRQDEAHAQLDEQQFLDPINRRMGFLQRAAVLVQGKRFDEALTAYAAAQAVDPLLPVPDFALGYAYCGKGLHAQAAEYFADSVDSIGGADQYSQPLVYQAVCYAHIPEKRAEARAILTRIESRNRYSSPALLAAAYAALDDKDKAISLLEQAYIRRDLLLRYIATGYEYDSLRDDPRFIDLMRRSGLDTAAN